MFHSDPSSAHYLFDLERLKAKLKDAKIVKTAKSFFGHKTAADGLIYFR